MRHTFTIQILLLLLILTQLIVFNVSVFYSRLIFVFSIFRVTSYFYFVSQNSMKSSLLLMLFFLHMYEGFDLKQNDIVMGI